jgi:hypothetical protein
MKLTRYGWWAAGVLGLVLTSGLSADDKPGSFADATKADQRLFDTLRDVINRGADLYNSGDPNGCYRLFQGALMVARPQFDHRPDLQKTIDAALEEAGRMSSMGARAFALHRVLNETRAKIDPKKPAEMKPVTKKPTDNKPTSKIPDLPADTKPAETKPDAKIPGAPADKKPTEDKPDAPKPADKKPTDTKPPVKPTTTIPDLTSPAGPRAVTPDAEITGKVTLTGIPLGKGTIQLVAEENGVQKAVEATLNADGTYALKGVKPGTYVVTLKTDADKLPAQYGDPKKSPVRMVVTKGKQEHNIELKDAGKDSSK